ncbi:hypothetical protein ACET3Z_017968 [Daucus carota]
MWNTGVHKNPALAKQRRFEQRKSSTKAAKRKGKGKATTTEVEEYEAFEANDLRKMTIMETVNEIRQKDIETRQRELEAKQTEMDLQVILADNVKMKNSEEGSCKIA